MKLCFSYLSVSNPNVKKSSGKQTYRNPLADAIGKAAQGIGLALVDEYKKIERIPHSTYTSSGGAYHIPPSLADGGFVKKR